MGGRVPCARCDRLRRSDLDRVGGRGHGPAARRRRGGGASCARCCGRSRKRRSTPPSRASNSCGTSRTAHHPEQGTHDLVRSARAALARRADEVVRVVAERAIPAVEHRAVLLRIRRHGVDGRRGVARGRAGRGRRRAGCDRRDGDAAHAARGIVRRHVRRSILPARGAAGDPGAADAGGRGPRRALVPGAGGSARALRAVPRAGTGLRGGQSGASAPGAGPRRPRRHDERREHERGRDQRLPDLRTRGRRRDPRASAEPAGASCSTSSRSCPASSCCCGCGSGPATRSSPPRTRSRRCRRAGPIPGRTSQRPGVSRCGPRRSGRL